MKMKKGIIFDLDGTLLNTLYDLKEAVNYALKKHGFQEITLEQTRTYVGNGIRQLVLRAMGKECDFATSEEVIHDFKDYYDKHQKDFTVPYDGIEEMIKNIYHLNLKMAIVSNKYQEGVDNLCAPLFGKYIDVFIGSREGLKLKPSPDMVYLACQQLNLNPEECYFVGDSDTDAMTGKNANMKVIGVTWGYRDEELLQQLNVDYIIHHPSELISILKTEEKNNG